jgi:hypothetical protein
VQDDVAECIKRDYVAVVGTSEYFPILSRSFPFIDRQAARAGLRNLEGAMVISGGGQIAQGGRAENYELAEEVMDAGDEIWSRNRDWANKMMFAAQAVRGLQVNAAGADYKTLIYCTEGYNSAQQAAIRAAGARHASPGRTFAVNSASALIAKLNEASFAGDSCSRRIWRMDVYAHGVPGDLALGYSGANESALSFTAAQARRLNKERFDNNGVPGRIYSWACQTAKGSGNAAGGLAQDIANATGATVYAYARRTEYTNTWNTGTQTAEQAGLTEIAGSGSRVLWHPDGALRGVIEGTSPSGNPSGQFTLRPQ